MCTFRIAAAMALLLFTAAQSWADNDVRVTSAKPGKKAGTIEIEGIVTADEGWAATSGASLDVWEDGCLVSTYRLSLAGKRPDYTFSFIASELNSMATYNILVEVTFTDKAKNTKTYRSQPTTAAAK
jgi:hypothetical protein